MSTADLFDALPSVQELARQLRAGKTSATSIAQTCLSGFEALDAQTGAYIFRNHEYFNAVAEAADKAFTVKQDHGPLQGIPVSVKDLYGVPQWPTMAGSPQVLPSTFSEAGPIVAALNTQGAMITGKTHTVEFAFGGLGTNPHHPVPRNPWDAQTHRVPGGSSAGAGVSLHVDALIALGTDTAGSVRIPAAMTGVAGLKTTHGRWSLEGIVPLSPSFDTPGVLARTVEDVAYAFAALDGGAGETVAEARLSGLRLGRCDDELWEECSAGVVEAVEHALAELNTAGAVVKHFTLETVVPALGFFRVGHLASAELHEFLSTQLPDWMQTLDPGVAARMADVSTMPAYEYLHRRRELARLQAMTDLALQDIDALVMPTVAITPPPLDQLADLDNYRHCNLLALRNTAVANMLRLCALTLPVGLDACGMPVGLQILMRAGQDEKLLAVGQCIEDKLGQARERLGTPPLHKTR